MRRIGLALGVLCAWAAAAVAAPQHGLSIFGDLKYPPDFRHFDYVNPDAPKGGRIVTMGVTALESFDSFNGYILKGDAAQNTGLLFDSLMVRATDEPDAMYGLLAASVDVAADKMSVTFELRSGARFADGTPVTAADACETLRLLQTSGHPNIRTELADIAGCEAEGPLTLRYTFKGQNVRDLPLTIAEQPVFSKAYYAAHDFAQSSLDPPLGSGPYRVGPYTAGQNVTYVRRPDYWAKDLPVNRGRYNFDEVKYEYYLDRTAQLEALKSGVLDLREEFSSRAWANDYEGLRSIAEKRLLRDVLPDETPSGAQGFFLNMRRAKLSDIRVRRALGLMFDFEWSNRNLFYGLYERTASFFQNSPLKAEGAPSPEELAFLEPLRAQLRPEVFGPAVMPPVSNGSGTDRKLYAEAARLLDEAGWVLKGNDRVNAAGEPLALELLIDNSVFERIVNPYAENLKQLGIAATVRLVDDAQYQRLLEAYDYDMIISRFSTKQTPGVEINAFFSSAAADMTGTYNLAGVKNAAIDALIGNVIRAKNRAELIVAGRALDRVLRAEYFWVPNWHKASHWIAYWDIFGKPAAKPAYDRGIIDTWWIDAAKSAKLVRGN